MSHQTCIRAASTAQVVVQLTILSGTPAFRFVVYFVAMTTSGELIEPETPAE